MPHALEEGIDPAFLERLAPFFRRLRGYFRLQVDGLEHLPSGPAILAANHTGWLGLDYALTALSVHDAEGRYIRGMAHEAWFRTKATADFARRVGLFEVSKQAMAKQLGLGNLVMVFPEGEKGAFRPNSDYTLEEFARGFVRVAFETGVPVVPVCVLGGEESNPVGRRLESYEDLLKLSLPVPKNLIPKPVKWRLRFLPPIEVPKEPEAAGDAERVHALAREVRERIQKELRRMKVERGHPYL